MSDHLNNLRDEAGILVPAFDESLHARLMSGVNTARRRKVVGAINVPKPLGTWGRLAVAAGMGFSVVCVLAYALHAESPAQFSPIVLSLRDSTAPIAEGVARPFDRATREISLIGSDAADFGRFVRDQLDFLPILTTEHQPPL